MNYSKLIFELSRPGRVGYELVEQNLPEIPLEHILPLEYLRNEKLSLPEVSELDLLRHYTALSRKNFGVETGFYPLGSCTMKYNPKINEEVASYPGFRNLHPLQAEESLQGVMQIYAETIKMLSEITGMADFSLHPFAGAHGELVGMMIMKAYHERRNDHRRTKVLIPDSAHGTNPASAAMLGYEIITLPSTSEGIIDYPKFKTFLSEEVAGVMLTNPNTLGLFEKDIALIAEDIHAIGGLLYYDGANLNPLLGVARPGDMGFDIIHLNLHKTFSTPHGGGGPGSGPVGVSQKLVDLLPNPSIKLVDNKYKFVDSPASIGHIGAYFGNFLVVLRAYAYLRTMGSHLQEVGFTTILNANYVKEKLKDLYYLPINTLYMHEFVFDGLINKTTGIKTLDIAKRLLDFGIHAPTIYFPLLFEQSLMIEPPETESKETLDNFIAIMRQIAEEAIANPELLKNAPYHTPVRRIDETKAARHPILTYKDLLLKK